MGVSNGVRANAGDAVGIAAGQENKCITRHWITRVIHHSRHRRAQHDSVQLLTDEAFQEFSLDSTQTRLGRPGMCGSGRFPARTRRK